MHKLTPRLVLVGGLTILFAVSGLCQSTTKPVPKEVEAIAGAYTGTWTMYGIDGQGQVTKRGSWTDTMRAQNAVMKDDRAYVTTVDEMIFEGRPTPMKIDGKEGYLINKDGSLGDYFIETFGQVIKMQQMAQDTWVYSVLANPRELAPLGFTNVSSARHVVVKVVTREDGVETHRISRVTTVNWKDQAGKDRWIQYVSLQGVHKRRP
jgi:hypothetical protein